MKSRAEQHGPRMVRLKQAQTQMALSAAQAQKQAADARQAEAVGLRQSAAETLAGALMQPERGLSRSVLYDRLRAVAVVRAHALEVGHAAGELEAQVQSLQQKEIEHRQMAAAHHRKQQKLEQWQSRRVAEAMRHRERRRQTQEQEDYPCHRRSQP